VNPIVDVISVGASNPYGHPAPEALARLAEDRVLRTDEDGDVEISTDGKRLWVSTQR
jgi:competence protein ComEC